MPRITLIKPRQDTAANWTSVDPVLAAGEEGIESDTGLRKLGDGATAWTALAYAVPVPPDTYVPAATDSTVTGHAFLNTPTVIDPCAAPFNAPGVAGQSSYAALVAAIAALPAVGGTLEFSKGGTYDITGTNTLATSKSFNWKAKGGQAVLIRKTGTGNGVVIGGAARIDGIEIDGIAFASEAGAGDALVLEGVHRSKLNIIVPSAAGAGVRMKGCLCNQGRIFVCVAQFPYGAQVNPTVGLSLEAGATGTGTGGCNGNTLDVVAEGCTTSPGVGIDIANGDNNVILGTSEGNTIGLRWVAGSHDNVVHLYMEGNAGGNMTFPGGTEAATRAANTILPAVGVPGSFPGRVYSPDGNADTPGWTWAGDSDTGIWRLASGRMIVTSNAANTMDMQSTKWLSYVDLVPGTDSNKDLGLQGSKWNSLWLSGGLHGSEQGEPANPISDHGHLFFKDNGSGKTQLCVKFPTGASIVLATEA